MRKFTGTFAADTIARDNSRITIQAIHGSMQETWKSGTPILVAHDGCRPIGWSTPACIYLEPGRGRLLGHGWEVESQKELQELGAQYEAYLHDRIAKSTEKSLPRLKSLLEPRLNGSERPIDTDATTLVGRELARRVAPDIFGHEDKDGLVPLSLLSPVQVRPHQDTAESAPQELRTLILPGVFLLGDLLLFAHPYFRRSLSRLNPLNFDLLSALHDLGQSNPSAKIRLDPDAVGLAGTAHLHMEYAYWHGPLFNDSLVSIPTGVTVHAADAEQLYFNQVSRTEFWWQSRLNKSKNIREHIFEAEELRDTPTEGGLHDSYGCRYVHSIVRENDGIIEHLDGAIREYGEAEMLARMEADIASSGRRTRYTKLWRVDGRIPLGTWKTLIHHYFRENPLIGEYLTGQKDPLVEKIRQELHQHKSSSIVEQLVPYGIDAGSKIRLALSYRSASSSREAVERWVLPDTKLTSKETYFPVIDAVTVELCKALQRVGGTLQLPAEAKVVSFLDRYVSFAPVMHASRGALALTIQAMNLLVRAWRQQGEDFVVSFSLGVLENDQEMWLSTLGHLNDVASWLDCGKSFPPSDENELDAWFDFAKKHLGDAPAGSSRHLPELLHQDGRFIIVRNRVPPEYYTIRGEQGEAGHAFTLSIPPQEPLLQEAIESGKLTIQFAWLLSSVSCSICKNSYLECSHSACLDTPSSKPIFHGRPVFPFWTDRPA